VAGERRALTIEDRAEIATGLKAGWSPTRIASHIGRDRSVVWREISRNSLTPGKYKLVVTADARATRRRTRPKPRKVACDQVLEDRVRADLARGISPRQIAGRLHAEAADATLEVVHGSLPADGRLVSHEAIYQYVYALPKGELAKHGIRLRHGRQARRPRTKAQRPGPIVGMVGIEERSPEALTRKVPGHWEGDLIIGKGGKSAAATLVDRATRFVVILGLPLGKDSDGLCDALIDYADALPETVRKTLAWDQGSEMARHAAFTLATSMPVYFAEPRSPWQRPTNENTNGLIREYLPKGTEITHHQPYLNAIAEELNHRPRACLGFPTPFEALQRALLAAESDNDDDATTT
jgi:transposase, IS30 family